MMQIYTNTSTDNRCIDGTVIKNVLSEVFPSLAPNNSCLTTQMSWSYSGTYTYFVLKLNNIDIGLNKTLIKIVFQNIQRQDTQIDQAVQSFWCSNLYTR